ncbi:multicopper oxidase family protein [Jannaschia sp. W003]|uniref:multicopper oxidase family protein n=1 Tax=Jannaschia sp. W003 TaxID=2867012 RepID=UPI0021A67BDD|nr:multicopper oxidase family protein [Jannaschia sp. W003]UWQ21468.1 multicopper oxidase family protein [Jannaschia sp. W003]
MILKPTRRAVLAAGAAAALVRPAAARAGPTEITARGGRAQLLPAGHPETPVWGYDGTVPGPEIRVAQGARVERRLRNALDVPTATHWHGIRLPNAMDGVPGLTQDAVAPGETFDYAFAVPDAGTYWYHAHRDSTEQVGRGLRGPLVIEEREGAPEVDAEHVLMLEDWRLGPDGMHQGAFGMPHDDSHGGRIGNVVTTNGAVEPALPPAAPGARLRLRIVNAANARVFTLGLEGLEGWTVALDGMPLEAPEPIRGPLVLGPAQRADLVVDVTAEAGAEAFLVHLERDGGYVQASIPVAGAVQARRPVPAPLPPNPAPRPAMTDARPLGLVLAGGAMGGMRGASVGSERMDARTLAGRGLFWSLGGHAGPPDAPLAELARGETVRMVLRNETAWPHAMHLHGHHFAELGPDGRPGALRDTTLVAPRATAEIAFAADNPGDWLVHCHMLGHAASGMTTWLRVA